MSFPHVCDPFHISMADPTWAQTNCYCSSFGVAARCGLWMHSVRPACPCLHQQVVGSQLSTLLPLLSPASEGQLYGLRRWRRWLNIGRPVIFSRDGSREKVHTRCVFESVFCRIVILTTLARMMASNHLLSSCKMRLRWYHDLSIILSKFVKSLSTFLLK